MQAFGDKSTAVDCQRNSDSDAFSGHLIQTERDRQLARVAVLAGPAAPIGTNDTNGTAFRYRSRVNSLIPEAAVGRILDHPGIIGTTDRLE